MLELQGQRCDLSVTVVDAILTKIDLGRHIVVNKR